MKKEDLKAKLLDVEKRVEEIEKIVKACMHHRKSSWSSSDAASSSKNWVFVDEHEVNENLIQSLLSLYVVKNIIGYEEFLRSLFPASLHLLAIGDDLSNPVAAIVVKRHPCGKHLKIAIHASRALVPAVAEKYIELLLDPLDIHFCELGNGQLETEIRKHINNVGDIDVVSFISQIGRSRIIQYDEDPRRKLYPLHDGSPCPIFSYLTSSNKRLALYGNGLIKREEDI